MTDSKCKICRRAGEKLFLKGEKCFTPKCVFNKKPYPPGRTDSERKHRSILTEYGKQLREKQKVKNTYGVMERQFANYVTAALLQKGTNPSQSLFESLEARLDNVVFRTGLASSRALARQMVSHGHITVNGKKVTIPSYRVRQGDKISVRGGSRRAKLFLETQVKLSKHKAPAWLSLESDNFGGSVTGNPGSDKGELAFNLSSVVEFYSRS
ncbi:MAG: 30S ribosomal protein S4 [Patescibacteria group bacterium]